MRFKLQSKQERGATFRTVAIALLGTIISVSGLLKLTSTTLNSTPSGLLIWLAEFAVVNPIALSFFIFTACWLWVVMRSGYLQPEAIGIFKYLQQATSSLPKLTTVTIYFSIGLLAIYWALKATFFEAILPS